MATTEIEGFELPFPQPDTTYNPTAVGAAPLYWNGVEVIELTEVRVLVRELIEQLETDFAKTNDPVRKQYQANSNTRKRKLEVGDPVIYEFHRNMEKILDESAQWEQEAKRLRRLYEPTNSVRLEHFMYCHSAGTRFHLYAAVVNDVDADGTKFQEAFIRIINNSKLLAQGYAKAYFLTASLPGAPRKLSVSQKFRTRTIYPINLYRSNDFGITQMHMLLLTFDNLGLYLQDVSHTCPWFAQREYGRLFISHIDQVPQYNLRLYTGGGYSVMDGGYQYARDSKGDPVVDWSKQVDPEESEVDPECE